MAFLTVVLWATVPMLGKYHLEIPVDLLELNHVYSLKGEYRFSQIIAWERQRATGHFCVREWFIVDYPRDDPRVIRRTLGGLYEVYRDTGRPRRKMYSELFIETHTPYDREVDDQRYMPKEYRLLLPITSAD